MIDDLPMLSMSSMSQMFRLSAAFLKGENCAVANIMIAGIMCTTNDPVMLRLVACMRSMRNAIRNRCWAYPVNSSPFSTQVCSSLRTLWEHSSS